MSLSSSHCRTRSTPPPKDNSDTRKSFQLHRSLRPVTSPSCLPWHPLYLSLAPPASRPRLVNLLEFLKALSQVLFYSLWTLSPQATLSVYKLHKFVCAAVPNCTSQPRALPSWLSTTIWISNWRCSKLNPCSSPSFILFFLIKQFIKHDGIYTLEEMTATSKSLKKHVVANF